MRASRSRSSPKSIGPGISSDNLRIGRDGYGAPYGVGSVGRERRKRTNSFRPKDGEGGPAAPALRPARQLYTGMAGLPSNAVQRFAARRVRSPASSGAASRGPLRPCSIGSPLQAADVDQSRGLLRVECGPHLISAWSVRFGPLFECPLLAQSALSVDCEKRTIGNIERRLLDQPWAMVTTRA